MSLRDLVLTVFILGSLPFILKRPWYGALLYLWVSVMSPHRLTWGFAYNMPFAQLVALATLAALFFSSGKKSLPLVPVTVVLLIFVGWMTFTTLFAIDPGSAWPAWERAIKIQLMVFVTMCLLQNRQHIHWMMWVLTLSIAYYGTKGGLFTIMGGGAHRVYGPGGSFIEENNALALTVVMTIPLIGYLRMRATNRWVRLGLLGGMVLCGFSALGSHSRGALVAMGAMLGFLWLKTRSKVMTGMLLLMLVPFAIGFMPEKWVARMHTIQTYEEDSSAMGRLNAWQMAINLAIDRPIGGGFEMYNREVFGRYAPNPLDVHAAHSIYFQVLGEHGFFGLGLFLLIWFLLWRDAGWIIRRSKGKEDWQWANDLARMVQVSMVGYLVGGTFLNLAYFDVPYYLLVAIVLTRSFLEKELKDSPESPEGKGWYSARQRPAGPGAGAGGRPPAPAARLGAAPRLAIEEPPMNTDGPRPTGSRGRSP